MAYPFVPQCDTQKCLQTSLMSAEGRGQNYPWLRTTILKCYSSANSEDRVFTHTHTWIWSPPCRGRWSKRLDHQLAPNLDPGTWRLLAPSLYLECGFHSLSYSQRLLQRQSLEIMMWSWKHLHGIRDRAQLEPRHKLLQFGEWLRGWGFILLLSKTSLKPCR